MSFDGQRLYDLLPAIYRIRDHEQGGPLRELLDVLADQVAVLEENLDQLYDDQFIETCADWVAPYIGGLIGYRSLYGVVPRISSPRAEVAHTIAFRRRKGTASMLEQLARDVTGWNANVVEYFLHLGWTQYMNHIRLDHAYGPDMRNVKSLERLGTPFDSLAHTVDVRSIERREGLYNIPNIGIFLWRLNAYPLRLSDAVKVDDRRYLFSPLGRDTQLFTNPEPEVQISHLAEPINVPEPIRRRVLDAYLEGYYGPQLSLLVRPDSVDAALADVVAADLSDAGGGLWAHRPADKIAIDPVLGRIAFPENVDPPSEVLVSHHYGFADDVGGGEYERGQTLDALLQPVQSVGGGAAIQPALDAVQGGGVVEITDSRRYEETIAITVNDGQRVELRADNQHRPTLVLGGDLVITGGVESEVTINGLLVAGGTLRVSAGPANRLRKLTLRHCTLVPGLSLAMDGAPEHPDEPSLVVEPSATSVEIDHCIVGGLRVGDDVSVVITDSIVDATSVTGVAYAAPDGESAGGALQCLNATIVGKVHTTLLDYASNCIFQAELAPGDTWTDAVLSDRRQTGCVRFSFLDLSARVPRRYCCQPDLEIETRIAEKERNGPKLTAAERAAIEAQVVAFLKPRFTSLRYGDPGYSQLQVNCPPQIQRGADDEAEMGAFHELYEPQRETNLRVRLEEYLRFGLEAGVFYAS